VALGRLELADGKTEEARRLWEQGLSTSRLYVFVELLMELAAETRHPERLLRHLNQRMKELPEDPAWPFYLGLVCMRLEMLDEALDAFGVTLTLVPAFRELDMAVGEARLRRGEIEEAAEAFKRALGLDRRIRIDYACPACRFEDHEWFAPCPACGTFEPAELACKPALS